MKFLYLMMAVMAAASATEKRFLFETVHFDSLLSMFGHAELTKYVNMIVDTVGSDATEQQYLHFDNLLSMFGHAELTKYVNMIVDLVGSDATEQQCETACLEVMHSDLLDTGCPLICTSFQSLVHKLHIEAPAQAPAKRFFLDNLHFDNLLSMFGHAELTKYVNMIVDLVGSDATEQQCETACLEVMHSDLLDTGCPLICSSFQSVVSSLHIDTPAQAPAKRFFLDNLHFDNLLSMFGHAELTKYVNLIVDLVGSDATEQQCETACLEVMHSDLLDSGCPLICTSFQSLVSSLHIDTPAQAPAKRFFLDNLHFDNLLSMFGHSELTKYVNQIVDLVGSDATEQLCETACLEVMHSDLLDTGCPLICTSFQSLVFSLHIDTPAQAPAKRFFLDNLHFDNLLSMFGHAELTKYVNMIVDLVGSDATEQQCETACLEVMHSDLLDTGCPLICTSFQSLVSSLHIDTPAQAPAKRFFLDNLHLDNLLSMFGHSELTKYVNQIVDLVGSDATEQQCETACLEVMHSDLLDTGCSLICTSFQSLVSSLHIDTPAQAPAKRFFLDTLHFGNLLSMFGHAELTKYVNQIVDLVGSDATEQQCEAACLEVMHSDLLDTGCPLICTSFQSLVSSLHIDTPAQAPAKRFFLDNLHFDNLLSMFGHAELTKYVNMIVDLVGSDATEQQCETACLEVMHSDLLDTGCPLICTSFQSLVSSLHIDTPAQAAAKRFFLDNLHFDNLLSMFGHSELTKYVNQIVDLVGSDATEQQCETACFEVMHSDLLDTGCPLICTSFQSLVSSLHIDTPAQAPAKRFFLDNLNFGNLLSMFGHAELTKYVNQIVDLVGSDATEQQCEAACLEVMHSDLLDTGCPLICTSFPSLVSPLHIDTPAQAPAKRFFLDNLHFDNLLSMFGHAELTKYVNMIVDLVGSDATEQQCETACLEVMHSDLLDTGCPLICTSFRSLVSSLHIDTPAQAPAKRFFLDNLNLGNLLSMFGHCELTKYVNQIVDLVGSDATEQQCETACLKVMHSDLLDTGCPLICTSFQSLVSSLHIDTPAQAPAKRFFLDNLHFDNLLSMFGHAELTKYVNLIVDQVGSDATEQQCETACVEVMHSDLFDTGCPLICSSFQSLVQKLHIDAPATAAQ